MIQIQVNMKLEKIKDYNLYKVFHLRVTNEMEHLY